MPQAPKPSPPPSTWPHCDLWKRIQEAIRALPGYFQTKTNIEGMLATDIFTLNAALSATIEEQVVATLNDMRPLWDPDKKYQSYIFVRQTQTFPDVLLRRKTNGQEIIMGIELKGWYLLAKEGMPNFRFTVNKNACNPQDLIVVVPWALSNVLAGAPVVYSPLIELARYAAEQRNYYWKNERDTDADSAIIEPTGVKPYPTKSDQISDKAKSDSGGNFGRLARYGTMSGYIKEAMDVKIRGIEAKQWLTFFKQFKEGTS
jgi:hypothetical protein